MTREHMSGGDATARAATLLAGFVLAACGACEAPPAGVRRLAEGLVRSAGLAGERPWREADGALVLVPAEEPGGFWVREAIPAAAWRIGERFPRVWSAPRRFIGMESTRHGAVRRRLVGAEREYAPGALRKWTGENVPIGYFAVLETSVLATSASETGPGDATLWQYVELGIPGGGACRTALEGWAGEGFALAPGFPAEIRCELGGPSELLFRSCAQGTGAGELTLEVLLDGEPVLRRALAAKPRASELSHRVALPAAHGARVLTFRVTGPAATCAILAPVVAPRATEAPPDSRPDLVLFVADTFRADNLAAYGGPDCVTPALDEFARAGLVFERTYAPASWTLPSHAALFSGLYPHQVGVRAPRDALTGEVATLTEALLAAGYRTAAITEAAFVSQEYGLAQGFEYFSARRRKAPETVQEVEAFLAADDGRPTFLFVHTYRAHHPYVVSESTSRAIGARIGLRADLDAREYATLPKSIPDWTPGRAPAADELRRMSDYQALYRGAAADLDALFRDVVEVLRRGPRAPVVVFTSDHGEAFWEHGIAEHGNGVWNEHLEIPLVLAGPGIAAGRSGVPASLIDLPRTVAGLAGIPPDPRWGGIDLLGPAAERALFAFQCDMHSGPSSFALFARGKKLVFSDDPAQAEPRLEAAFDLSQDPREREDLSGRDWAAELARAYGDAMREARRPRVEADEAVPGDAALEELGRLGYADR